MSAPELYKPPAPPPDYDSKNPIAFAEMGFRIESFEQAWRFAASLCAAGMVPKAYQNHPGAVIVIMQACAQLGIPLHVGLSNLTFTNGRFGVMGDLAVALVRRSGKLKAGTDIEVHWSGEPFTPEWTCTVKAWRADQDRPRESAWTLADAIRAGRCRIGKHPQTQETVLHTFAGKEWIFSDAPWSRYPQRMMYYRPLGFLMRDLFGDVLMGFYVQEELDDIARREERDVTPAPPRPAHEGTGPAKADPLLALPAETAPELKIPEVMGGEDRELVGLRHQTADVPLAGGTGGASERRSQTASEPAQADVAGPTPAPVSQPAVIEGDRAKQDRLF